MDARATAQVTVPRLSIVRPTNHGLSDRTGSPRFLIATDDDELYEIVNDAVRLLGHTAAFVRSGSDAMTRARAGSLRLLLLDQCLSDVAGLDVARALRCHTAAPPFVLLGRGLATSITVEAMKLGALTVLEKPVAVNEIVGTIRSATVDIVTAMMPTAHATTTVGPFAPRSISERWALHVLKACDADGDLRTLGAWAAFVGLSYSSLCESCRLVGIQPLDARDLARVLRAVFRSRHHDCCIEDLLDISDRRTLKILMTRAGLDPEGDRHGTSVEQFLGSQRFVPPSNAGFLILRTLLLG